MNRVTKALGLLGWLLVQPPVRTAPDGTVKAVVDAPISRWSQLEAFDTAKECEARAAESAALALKVFENDRALANKAGMDTSLHLRCVPADRVYPEPEPSRE